MLGEVSFSVGPVRVPVQVEGTFYKLQKQTNRMELALRESATRTLVRIVTARLRGVGPSGFYSEFLLYVFPLRDFPAGGGNSGRLHYILPPPSQKHARTADASQTLSKKILFSWLVVTLRVSEHAFEDLQNLFNARQSFITNREKKYIQKPTSFRQMRNFVEFNSGPSKEFSFIDLLFLHISPSLF